MDRTSIIIHSGPQRRYCVIHCSCVSWSVTTFYIFAASSMVTVISIGIEHSWCEATIVGNFIFIILEQKVPFPEVGVLPAEKMKMTSDSLFFVIKFL